MKYKMADKQRLHIMNMAVDDLFFNAQSASTLLNVRICGDGGNVYSWCCAVDAIVVSVELDEQPNTIGEAECCCQVRHEPAC